MWLYLGLQGILLGVAVAVRVAAYSHTQHRTRAPSPHPQPLYSYDVAMLLGNSGRVVETALAHLVDSGAVSVHPGMVRELQLRQDAHQRPQDVVQHQVLDLIPRSRNLHQLTFAFARTDVAQHIRSRMASCGLMVVHRRHLVITWLIRALFALPLITTATFVGLGHTSGNDLFAMLIGHIFATFLPGRLCERKLPLNVTRSGKALRDAITNALDEPCPQRDVSADGLRKTREVVSSHAAAWSLTSEWISSTTGLVPFLGLRGYRGEQGERITFRNYGDWMSGFIRTPQGQNRPLGLVHRALGAGCALLGICLGLVGFFIAGNMLLILLAVMLIQVGNRQTVLGKKHQTPVGFQRLHISRRPPVLYLRSFDHDAILENPGPPIRSALFGSRTSYIEELTTAVRPFGDMVAIGNPTDSLPGLGPSHVYMPPQPARERQRGQLALWQSEVLRLMQFCPLVLISAGHGNGLRWEFEQVTSFLPPQRLVVLVPLSRADYQRFREQTGAYFRSGLPHDPRKKDTYESRTGKLIYGLIYFDQDWTPHFVQFKERPLAQLHLGRIAVRPSFRQMRNRLIHAMYPVFRNNQVHWQGFEIPVPLGRTSRHRVMPGASWSVSVFLLVGAVALSLPLLDALGVLHLS